MKASELQSKNLTELQTSLIELLKEQFSLRMQRGSGQMGRPHQFKQVRRNIARVKTVMNEKLRSGNAS
ncbi:MAG TPA: 50S ribosomal protein L29 [Gammaproteobacteria bacterium]|nr:50S ribosomal protein L29 [Gammaproteobacteria bacterium]